MEEQAHILVIDDDDRLRELLRRFLSESGFRVTDAASAAQAGHLLQSLAFDLLIIDVMMPGQDGVSFLSEIRQTNNVPALFLTALAETENRIDGLEAGADDYLAKPFEPRELILRIKRILSRQPQKPNDKTISFGAFIFEIDTGRLLDSGAPLHITTAERDLLAAFAKAPNETLSREDLHEQLEGRMEGRSIDVAIARLRRKLEDDPKKPVYLLTIRGAGWALRTGPLSGGGIS
ncbi:MAG: response regulator [Candidatus Puniceispirillaceae bacterium]